MNSTTLSLRKGNVSIIIDVTGSMTQKQWDAIGGLVTAMEQMERRLTSEGKSDD